MLWTIFVILLVLWLLGMVSSYTIGGFIPILLVIAVVVIPEFVLFKAVDRFPSRLRVLMVRGGGRRGPTIRKDGEGRRG